MISGGFNGSASDRSLKTILSNFSNLPQILPLKNNVDPLEGHYKGDAFQNSNTISSNEQIVEDGVHGNSQSIHEEIESPIERDIIQQHRMSHYTKVYIWGCTKRDT